MQSSMHDNVCLGAWKGIKSDVKLYVHVHMLYIVDLLLLFLAESD